MAEDHFMRPDGDRCVSDRRLPKLLTIEGDIGPRGRVDRDRALRPVRPELRDLARGDLDALRRVVAKRVVREFDVVTSRRHHDAVGAAAAEETLVLENLQFRRRVDRNPARYRCALRRLHRYDKRGGGTRLNRDVFVDGAKLVFERDRVASGRESWNGQG